eukprot:scaffold439295_cov15-Prasinocladus_malaysianus.AAC.1
MEICYITSFPESVGAAIRGYTCYPAPIIDFYVAQIKPGIRMEGCKYMMESLGRHADHGTI